MADATDNIAKALGYKEEGNTHFKAGEYREALACYPPLARAVRPAPRQAARASPSRCGALSPSLGSLLAVPCPPIILLPHPVRAQVLVPAPALRAGVALPAESGAALQVA